MDGICVFLWASMPVLVPFACFITCDLIDVNLSPQKLFTALALLGMLVYPMNALPWVVNGFIEGRVSAGRIGRVMASTSGGGGDDGGGCGVGVASGETSDSCSRETGKETSTSTSTSALLGKVPGSSSDDCTCTQRVAFDECRRVGLVWGVDDSIDSIVDKHVTSFWRTASASTSTFEDTPSNEKDSRLRGVFRLGPVVPPCPCTVSTTGALGELILVTGPVGCGKSTYAHACFRE